MPYIKDSFSILAECAAIDLPDTRRVVRESEVRSSYEDIEEVSINYEATAEIIPVIQIENEYFTEAQFLAPFMRDAGIRSMMEALDIIAEANHLPEKSVGLLIESDESVSAMIEKACQSKSNKIKDAVMDKVDKATGLAKNLKSKGYPVKKKQTKISESESLERLEKLRQKYKEETDKAAKRTEEKSKKMFDDAREEAKKSTAENIKKSRENINKSCDALRASLTNSYHEADMKTADDYRKRKEEESRKKDEDDDKASWRNHRLATGKDGDKYLNATHRTTFKNQDSKHDNLKNMEKNHKHANDAIMRHDRRHGVKEEVEDLFDFNYL